MANFRRNHQRADKSGFSSLLIRVFLFFGIAILAFVWFYGKLNNSSNTSPAQTTESEWLDQKIEDGQARKFLPNNSSGELIHHKHYSLSYIEKYEQAEWVAYRLTAASLRAPKVKRNKRFTEDYAIKSKSARHKDYSHSGYTRGHLAPAGDMGFSETAMKETFFMSNMSPQPKEFNGGVWRELEESVRDWSIDNEEIYIVTGPLFKSKPKDFIGSNRVAVPDHFYKVILDNEGREKKGIGFIIPNKKSTVSLYDYAVTIDEVEAQTGLDFFGKLLDANESQIESEINIKKWPLDKKRFKQRTNNWNNR